MENQQPETAQAFADSLGLFYSAEFVPQSKSRNAGDKRPTLNWRVTIAKSQTAPRLVTDYMQGCAHVPLYNVQPAFWRSLIGDRALRDACETGRYSWYARARSDGGQMLDASSFGKLKKLPEPKLTDVLYCLVSDAAVIEYPSFEDWAHEYGYDSDSRSAKKIYRACLTIALELRHIVDLDAARVAFENY